MKRGILGVVALALVLSGCSDDGDKGDDKSAGKDKTSVVTPDDFCSAFKANGGNETALRPVPANQPKVVIQGTVDRAAEAMKDITPPEPIKRQWTALAKHYESVAAEVRQLKPDQKLSKKRQRSLERQTERVFDDSGRAVVNFVLQHCS